MGQQSSTSSTADSQRDANPGNASPVAASTGKGEGPQPSAAASQDATRTLAPEAEGAAANSSLPRGKKRKHAEISQIY
ncbi:hypothetical protein N656DRAFT_785172 [Canariomyces notabilis]|uniref:Uncharacterized protein n=1 Tax=Canariomyces notabilis TaxID=2074819 RepID=A0AAN6QHJ4_9PEZI|nr:hypothetical protein N656DRAFT_785172 [Canariomyces arenarius]